MTTAASTAAAPVPTDPDPTRVTCPHGRLRTPPGLAYDVRADCRVCYLVDRGLREADDAPPRPPAPGYGPGTELKALLKSLGIAADGCGGCRDLAERMDRWGVAGCREPAAREEILSQLRRKAAHATWRTKIEAAVRAAAQGLYFSPSDPAVGLLDEAVRRAEDKDRQRVTESA